MERSRDSRPARTIATVASGLNGVAALAGALCGWRSRPTTTRSFSRCHSCWRSISGGRARRSNDGRRPMRPTRARASVNRDLRTVAIGRPGTVAAAVMQCRAGRLRRASCMLVHPVDPARRSPTSSPTGRSWSTAPVCPADRPDQRGTRSDGPMLAHGLGLARVPRVDRRSAPAGAVRCASASHPGRAFRWPSSWLHQQHGRQPGVISIRCCPSRRSSRHRRRSLAAAVASPVRPRRSPGSAIGSRRVADANGMDGGRRHGGRRRSRCSAAAS